MRNSISSIIFLQKLNNKKEWENFDFEINNNSIYFNCENNNNNFYYSLENIDIIDEKQSSTNFKLIIFNPHQIIFFKTFNLFDKNNILNLFSKFTGKKYSLTETNLNINENNFFNKKFTFKRIFKSPKSKFSSIRNKISTKLHTRNNKINFSQKISFNFQRTNHNITKTMRII